MINNPDIYYNKRISILSAFRCLALPLLVLILLMGYSDELIAQDHEEEEVHVDYIRPAYKVYKSLSYALSEPDSVFILELKGKKLTEIPAGVYKLPNLLVLDLSKNKIRDLPDSIGVLQNLLELDLTGNKIEEIPESIGELKGMKKLVLSRNVITNLPASIGGMTELEVLELWDNELETLPDEIRNLKKLKKLELRGILFSEEQQVLFHEMLPHTKIYMSPACNCKIY